MPDPDIVELGRKWFVETLNWIIGQFRSSVLTAYRELEMDWNQSAGSLGLIETPTPSETAGLVDAITQDPTGFTPVAEGPWGDIYNTTNLVSGGDLFILAVALVTLAVVVQGRYLLRTFNVGGEYEARKTRKRAWIGAFAIVLWYWLAVVSLTFVDEFTMLFLEQAQLSGRSGDTGVANFVTLVAGCDTPGCTPSGTYYLDPAGAPANTLLTVTLVGLGALGMWALEALLFLRHVVIFAYLYGMPLLLALSYGNVPVVSEIAGAIARKFVAWLVIPLPVVFTLLVYVRLFTDTVTADIVPTAPAFRYLVAVSFPLVAAFVTWRTFRYARPTAERLAANTTVLAGRAAERVGRPAGGDPVRRQRAQESEGAENAPALPRGRWLAGQVSTDEDGSTATYRRTENDPY